VVGVCVVKEMRLQRWVGGGVYCTHAGIVLCLQGYHGCRRCEEMGNVHIAFALGV